MLFPKRNQRRKKKIIKINTKRSHGAPARSEGLCPRPRRHGPTRRGAGRRPYAWEGGGGGGGGRVRGVSAPQLLAPSSLPRRLGDAVAPGSYLPPRVTRGGRPRPRRAGAASPGAPGCWRASLGVGGGQCRAVPCRDRRGGRAGAGGRRAALPALPAPSRQRWALHVPGSPAAAALCTARTRHRPPRPIAAAVAASPHLAHPPPASARRAPRTGRGVRAPL